MVVRELHREVATSKPLQFTTHISCPQAYRGYRYAQACLNEHFLDFHLARIIIGMMCRLKQKRKQEIWPSSFALALIFKIATAEFALNSLFPLLLPLSTIHLKVLNFFIFQLLHISRWERRKDDR